MEEQPEMTPIERDELARSVGRKLNEVAADPAKSVALAQAMERGELLAAEAGGTLGTLEDDSGG